jgi:hypothetical protein
MIRERFAIIEMHLGVGSASLVRHAATSENSSTLGTFVMSLIITRAVPP